MLINGVRKEPEESPGMSCLFMNMLMSLEMKQLSVGLAQSCQLNQNCFILIPDTEIFLCFACYSERAIYGSPCIHKLNFLLFVYFLLTHCESIL